MERCPYCQSDDLVKVNEVKTVCVECEASRVAGLWASGRENRRMAAAVADADCRFEDSGE
jgi:transcription initiation factor TFIIIB Brf1 subunit/transcription initiation factor TFIIB